MTLTPSNPEAEASSEAQDARPPAVVLLSGGLDSATVLAICHTQGYACHALSFDYGQRHRVELEAAKRVADSLGVVSHQWVTLDLRAFGGSALTDDTLSVPKRSDIDDATQAHAPKLSPIPVTYVPARNTIFLSYALAFAEVIGAQHIFAGMNAVDYSGYPDCRPEYLDAYQTMARLATREGVEGRGVTLHAPLMHMRKTEIVQRGLELGVDYALTHSCYDPGEDGRVCRDCDACRLRQDAFEALGRTDPVL